MKQLKLIFILIIFFIINIKAQNNSQIHLICSIDRFSNIGESCKTDFRNMKSLFKSIGSETNLIFNIYDVEFDKNKTDLFIKNFNCDTNDVVIFYYSGHGYRFNNQDAVWPYLNICKNEEVTPDDCAISLKNIYEAIIKKNPRLLIAIGDCCNNQIDWDEPLARNVNFKSPDIPKGYKKLFLDSKGYIIASGSLPMQYSHGTKSGGLFTNGLIKAITNSKNIDNANWKNVFFNARTTAETNSRNRQRPHFMISHSEEYFYSEGLNLKKTNITIVDSTKKDSAKLLINNKLQDEDIEENDYIETEMKENAIIGMTILYLYGSLSDDEITSETEVKLIDKFVENWLTKLGCNSESEKLRERVNTMLKEYETKKETIEDAIILLSEYFTEKNTLKEITDSIYKIADNNKSEKLKQFVDYLYQAMKL